MNKQDAHEILKSELLTYRSKEYEELAAIIGSPLNYERQGPSGATYHVEIQAFWDKPRESNGNIRVIASIDDGRFLSSFIPLSSDFILGPDGNFVGE